MQSLLIIFFGIWCNAQSATYVLDTSFNSTIKTFVISDPWVSPPDSSLFFVGRTSEGGPYQFYEISITKSNQIINEWRSGDWSQPEMIEVSYGENPISTKLWFADEGKSCLSRFDVMSGKVDGHIGTEGVEGTGINPIQFVAPGEINFVPNSSGSEDRILFFGDSQPFMPCHRFGKITVLLSEPLINGVFQTKTEFIVGTNGTVETDIEFVDITSIAYDKKRDWLWINDYVQYQVYVYDGSNGKFVGKWPCDANEANGGVYFDRQRDIFWQVIADAIQAYNVSHITNAADLDGFNCTKGTIFRQEFHGKSGQPTGLAVDSHDGSVYVAISHFNIDIGSTVYRYLFQS